MLLILRFGGILKPKLFAALAIALVVADLFQAGMGYNPAIPESHAVQPVTPASGTFSDSGQRVYVAVTPYAGVNPLPPDVNIRYGLYDLRGYDLPVVAQFGNVWTRYIAPTHAVAPFGHAVGSAHHHQRSHTRCHADLFTVRRPRNVLEDTKAAPLHMTGLHLVHNGTDARIYANSEVLPRTWLVTNQDVVKNAGQALTGIVAPSFNPRQTVLTEHRLPGLSEQRSGEPPPVPRTSRTTGRSG